MRLLMVGYFGFGNAGDEAVLAAEVEALRAELGPATEFLVVSGSPADTRARHGLSAVRRGDAPGLLRALRGCDALVAGGGSLLQDVTSARPVAFYGGLMLAARAVGRPVFAYGQGLGPLRRRANRLLAGWALRGSTYAGLRDAGSCALAGELGAREVDLVADPVLGMDLLAERQPAGLAAAGSSGARLAAARPSGARLAVALRPWPGQDRWLPPVRAGLAELVARGVEVVLVPFHAVQDAGLARELGSDLGVRVVRPAADPRASLAAVAGADAVLGMRLHALIGAAAAGRPFVALAYDPKVTAFADRVGQPVAATLPGPVRAAELVRAVEGALAGPEPGYARRVSELAVLARRPAAVLASRVRDGCFRSGRSSGRVPRGQRLQISRPGARNF